jgi:predicted lysophospholipase L1 biosynthesis ABC-type transport system permease subunit
MGMRLVGKSIVLGMRSRRRFIVFTIFYTVLVFWMAISWEGFLSAQNWYMLATSLIASIVLAILYAWIIINYRKTEIATLKCIGWTNGNIRTLIVGEILWVSFIAFVVVAEILIHYAAAVNYYWSQNSGSVPDLSTFETNVKPFLDIVPVVVTFAVFLVAQIIGILVLNNKLLKLRPIVALRVIK